MGHRLSEDELQQALDFCGKLFAPTSPDEHRAAERLLAGQVADNPNPRTANLKFLDVHAPVIDPQVIETVVREQLTSVPRPTSDTPNLQSNARDPTADSGYNKLDIKTVLEKVNARRVIHSEHGGVHNFEDEPLGQLGTGSRWVARLKKGKLGLVHVDTSACQDE